MPRKIVPPEVLAPLPPPQPSPLVQKLRQDWRWAGISQFIWTFSDAFGLVDWSIENLEKDLDGEETTVPDLIAKLLYALTWNRQITKDNAFEHLRRQYLKRLPEGNVLGTEEDPVEWATLGLSTKVQVLWQLCEWQLQDPARFRSLLKTEEEATSWRVDPVGWDKQGNTYYLFDDNRLWVQRSRPAPPRPAKKSSVKAKRAQRAANREDPPPRRSHKKKDAPQREATVTPPPEPEEHDLILSGRRKRTQVQFYGNVTPTVEALKRGSRSAEKPTPSSTRSTRSSGRLAQTDITTPTKLQKPTSLPRGTRMSRRLHADVDDEWQQVPDEWLTPVRPASRPKGKGKKAVDEESELSDLTDEDEHEAFLQANGVVSDGIDACADYDNSSDLSDAPQEVLDNQPKPGDKDHEVDTAPSLDPTGNPEAETAPTANDIMDAMDDIKTEDPVVVSSQNSIDLTTPGIATKVESGDMEAEHGTVKVDELDEEAEEIDHKVQINGSELQDEAGTVDVEQQAPELGEEKDAQEGNIQSGADGNTATVDPEPEDTDEVKLAIKEADNPPEGFIEWEAVCVTLYDWKTWPEQFAKSRDPDEKALYRLLEDDIAPQIIEVLTVKEQERIKQEAINNRKRSSRIAIKELEREEAHKREAAQHEMEQRMERLRQDEARKEKEQEEARLKEEAREARLREREERVAAREAAQQARAESEARTREKAERRRERRKRRRDGEEVSDSSDEGERASAAASPGRGSKTVKSATASAAGTPNSGAGSWELRCEVCMKTGWNLPDDDNDLVCCDGCGRWQHVKCHDRQDIAAGRGLRDWEKVDFQCRECLQRAANKRRKMKHDSGVQPPVGNGNPESAGARQAIVLQQQSDRHVHTQYYMSSQAVHQQPSHLGPRNVSPQRQHGPLPYVVATNGHHAAQQQPYYGQHPAAMDPRWQHQQQHESGLQYAAHFMPQGHVANPGQDAAYANGKHGEQFHPSQYHQMTQRMHQLQHNQAIQYPHPQHAPPQSHVPHYYAQQSGHMPHPQAPQAHHPYVPSHPQATSLGQSSYPHQKPHVQLPPAHAMSSGHHVVGSTSPEVQRRSSYGDRPQLHRSGSSGHSMHSSQYSHGHPSPREAGQ